MGPFGRGRRGAASATGAPRRAARAALVACTAAAALAVPASAAAEIRTGGVTDPVPDGTAFDAERVELSYDSERGRIELLVRFEGISQYGFGGSFVVDVGSTMRDGQCVADAPGDLHVHQTVAWDLAYGGASVNGGPDLNQADGGPIERFPTYVFSYEDPSLVGRDYLCTTPVVQEFGDPRRALPGFTLSSRTNHVANPSFETGTDGWGSYQGTLSRVEVPDAPDGTAVVQAARRTGSVYSVSDEQGGAQPTIPSTVAGARYMATATVRAATRSSLGETVEIVLRERDAEGDVVRETSSSATLDGVFERVAVTATATATGNTLGLRVIQTDARRGDAFHADELTVRPAAAVVGKDLVGSVWTALGPDVKRISDYGFIAPSAMDVSELRAYVDGGAASSGSQPVRGVIYADGNLLARTSRVTIDAGRAPGWVTLRFASPVRLDAGFYALGLHSGGSRAVGRYAATPTGWPTLAFGPDRFFDGPADVLEGTTGDTKYLSIYAVGG